MEEISGREIIVLSDIVLIYDVWDWDECEFKKLIFYVMFGFVYYLDFIFENGSIDLVYIDYKFLVEFWVFVSFVDDFGGDGVVRVVCEREFGVDVLVVVDVDVVDVFCVVNKYLENFWEVLMVVEFRWRSLF